MSIQRLRVNQQSTRNVSFSLVDSAGAPVPLDRIQSMTLTLYDMDTDEAKATSPLVGIINGRSQQDVLNNHNVLVHATSGLVTWDMQPEDNPIVTSRRQIERHRAEFNTVTVSATSPTETSVLNYAIEIEVLRMRGIAA